MARTSASRWISESTVARIIPAGAISIGCRYTAPTSSPGHSCGSPMGYSLANACGVIRSKASDNERGVRMMASGAGQWKPESRKPLSE
ncbi:hypothetical protein D3C76_1436940 [compost metagenome]